MGRDLTTRTTQHARPTATEHATVARHHRTGWFLWFASAMIVGMLLLMLAYQIPATHTVNIGGYDSAYVQGFYDPEQRGASGDHAYLQGSDGSARWTRAVSYILLPQAGLPAQVTLRLRGWRASGPPPEVTVLLNGTTELGRFRTTGAWEEHTFTITGGLLKPNDVVIELRTDTAPLSADDSRPVGVLLDQATYRVGPLPITPYPLQLAYGALAAGLLWLLLNDELRTKNKAQRTASFTPLMLFILCSLFLIISWLFLYRLQPPYPYPLRSLLPAVDAALAGLLAWRVGPRLAVRAPALLDTLALGGIGIWTGAVAWYAQQHVTLSVPGVEKDFRVFATRSSALGALLLPDNQNTVLRADGFYNLGYPFLLWLVRPLTGNNPFLAARIIALLSGALLLGATWWLARRLLGRGPALLALLALALSPLIVEYALYVGTDMPFAALCMLTLALLFSIADCIRTKNKEQRTKNEEQGSILRRPITLSPRHLVILSGLAAGMAFLIRHPGILLLLVGWLVIWSVPGIQNRQSKIQNTVLFTLAFLVAILPQLVVNVSETGQPLYNQQAKNVWLAVFGNGDWGRWGETSDSITLGQVVAQNPGRFFANWWNNVRGFIGTGGEDTSEFGRAFQLRLLGFPANWLALAGLLGWLMAALVPLIRQPSAAHDARPASHRVQYVLLGWLLLYVVAVSIGLSLPRFFMPLAPVYAIAAAWAVWQLGRRLETRSAWLSPLTLGLMLALLLSDGFSTGTSYVLNNQPADEVAAVQLVEATLRSGEQLQFALPPDISLDKYSAIASRAAPEGVTANYLLQAGGEPLSGVTVIGQVGRFTLYRPAR